jgi:DNA polymerase III subunit delta
VVAVKHHQADQFLKALDPRLSAVLFYGPDAGLVLERAQQLSKALATRDTPPGEIIPFEDADLETDSDRLSVELQTMPMFGGRKIIRARTGRRLSTALLKPLIEAGGLQGFLIVEAGDLRPDEALRVLFEKSPTAAAVACFGDEAEGLETLAIRVLKSHGLAIAPDVLAHLVARLGADRALSRGELEKLALYVHGRRHVEADDIEASVGDSSDLRLDKIPEAAASGDAARAVTDADRAVASGDGAQAVLLATQRYFLRLHRLRASVDQGRSLEEAVRGLRPPVHFKLQPVLTTQLRAWTAPKLTAALAEIATAVKACRQTGALDEILTERLLLRLAFMGRGKG